MKIEVKIDENCTEPKVIVVSDKVTDEINELIRRLSENPLSAVAGFKDEIAEILEPDQIFRIYASGGKVFAATDRGEYTLRLRLYEVMQRFSNQNFARISNSEIINLKKVKGFDLSFTGTICVTLTNGDVTYVSRRYVPEIKKMLGM